MIRINGKRWLCLAGLALFGAVLTGQAMTSLGALGLPASIAVVFIAVGGLTLRLPARREASPIQVRGPGG